MPYSLLVLTINLQILALCLGVDLITLPKPNLIMSSISATRNSQLLVFLMVSIKQCGENLMPFEFHC